MKNLRDITWWSVNMEACRGIGKQVSDRCWEQGCGSIRSEVFRGTRNIWNSIKVELYREEHQI